MFSWGLSNRAGDGLLARVNYQRNELYKHVRSTIEPIEERILAMDRIRKMDYQELHEEFVRAVWNKNS